MIGSIPKEYLTLKDLKYKTYFDLLFIIQANEWEGDLFEGSTIDDWKKFHYLDDLRVAISAKMEEHKQELPRLNHD